MFTASIFAQQATAILTQRAASMELDDISFDMGEIADSGGTECGSDLIDGFVAPGYERVMTSIETVLRSV